VKGAAVRRRGKQGHVKASGESSARWALAGGLLAGVALDMALGDPRRWHPVAGFGKLATNLEQRMYQDSRLAGTAYALLAAGAPVVAAVAADTALRRRPLLRAAAGATVTWGGAGRNQLAPGSYGNGRLAGSWESGCG
jgi:adenosylcobinamide-phosphate synthase